MDHFQNDDLQAKCDVANGVMITFSHMNYCLNS